MPILAALLALIFPRVMIAILYFFTNFFVGVYNGILLPILGFLFMPVSLLCYTYVMTSIGQWSTFAIVIMVVAVTIDLGLWKNGTKSRK